MDILLVNPGARASTYQGLSQDWMALEPPLWCALPAAYLRERGFSVNILDAEVLGFTPEQTVHRILAAHPTMVCIVVQGSTPSTTSTPKMTSAIELCKALGPERDFLVVLSGLHPAALPERSLRETGADYVCLGEPFQSLVSILFGDENPLGVARIENGKYVPSAPAPYVDPSTLPSPAWDLLPPMSEYRCHSWHGWGSGKGKRSPYGIVYSSLGCTFACSFCNVRALYGGESIMRHRSAERVLEDLQVLAECGVRKVKFLDELFAVKPRRVQELCDLIASSGLDIDAWAYARVDTVNRTMLSQMKRAGIHWVAYGIESASEQVRDGVDKHMAQRRVEDAIRAARECGLSIVGNYIFGLPGDTLETMQATLEAAVHYNTEQCNLYCASALPGSDLYAQALKDNIPQPPSWAAYSQYHEDFLPLPTATLTSAQVLQFRDAAFQAYVSRPEYEALLQQRFGTAAVENVRRMRAVKLQRSLLRDAPPAPA